MHPYQNPQLPAAERVADLLARMTLEEKVAQLHQMYVRPDNREEIKALIRRQGMGSRILSATSLAGSAREQGLAAEDMNEIQHIAVEESRLGIPLLHGRDIIHGHRTVFPIPLAMAAAFDPELVEQAFTVAAREAASGGVHWSFAPMLDIARDPRWGRIIEGFGEDPYLAAKLAAAAVRGFQGDDPGDPERILACAKHYIGYGGAEGGRDYNTAEITETTLRNIYLPPFKAAVDAGVGSVMSGFHDLDGESVSGSYHLLTEILRQELGFEGFVVSDWGSVADLIYHRQAADRKQAAEIAFNAGVDMDMCVGVYLEHLAALVQSGAVSMERLDDAVRRVLTAKFKLGLFERPYLDPELCERVQYTPEHLALARKIAGRSLVLLQNNGILPLARDIPRLAVIGPLARQRRALLGSWVLDGVAEDTQNLLEAVRDACPQSRVPEVSDALTDEMLMACERADAVILAVGESEARNGENQCVASLDLPAGQDALIEAVHGMGKPVVLVVFAGRPVNLQRAARFVDAILYAWHPGSMGAAAVADALFGAVIPSGKLPISYPRSEGQIPIHYNHKSTGKPWRRYLDTLPEPLFPFGFGLSYTTFAYDDLRVEPAEIRAGGQVTVSARVTNTGSRAGEEVAQCYLQDCVASITRPVRELKGFARLALQPGESRRVSFTLGADELSFYNRQGKWVLEPGAFKVWVGGDATATLEGTFTVL